MAAKVSKTKDFMLSMLAALAGASVASKQEDQQDNDISQEIEETTKLMAKSNAFNEDAAIHLDSIYNFLVENNHIFEQNTPVKKVTESSAMPTLDSYFNDNKFIPVKVLNFGDGGYGEDSGDGGFDFDIDRERKRPRRTPRNRRTPRRLPRIPWGTLRKILPNIGRIGGYAGIIGGIYEIIAGSKYTMDNAYKFLEGGEPIFVSEQEEKDFRSGSMKQSNPQRYAELQGLLQKATVERLERINYMLETVGENYYNSIEYENYAKDLDKIAAITGQKIDYPKPARTAEPAVMSSVNQITERSELLRQNQYGEVNRDRQNIDPFNAKLIEDMGSRFQTTIDRDRQNIDPEKQKLMEEKSQGTNSSGIANPMVGNGYTPISFQNNNDYIELNASNIRFIADVIQFIYDDIESPEGDITGNGIDANEVPQISSDFSFMTAAYSGSGGYSSSYETTPGGGVTPQDTPMISPESLGNPTEAKTFLSSISANRSREGDTTNLNDDFAAKLALLIQNAPAGIREGLGVGSAYRSPMRQAEIISENMGKYGFNSAQIASWKSDVSTMGPEAAGAKWRPTFRSAGLTANIGMPGGSNHQKGLAVDLTYNGAFLKPGAVPSNVISWVHANANALGLHFPMGHEPWHIEPKNVTPNAPTTRMADDAAPTAPKGSDAPPSSSAPDITASAGDTATPVSAPVSSGKAISATSTETFANAKIAKPSATVITASANPSTMTTGSEHPYSTAGVAKPLAAMTTAEQRLFEESGLFV